MRYPSPDLLFYFEARDQIQPGSLSPPLQRDPGNEVAEWRPLLPKWCLLSPMWHLHPTKRRPLSPKWRPISPKWRLFSPKLHTLSPKSRSLSNDVNYSPNNEALHCKKGVCDYFPPFTSRLMTTGGRSRVVSYRKSKRRART